MASSIAKQRHRWLKWPLPVLIILYVAQCVWFIRTQSLTYDEPVHIAEGLDAWRDGRFQQFNDHPPLARLLCALPLLSPKWQVQIEQLPVGFKVAQLVPDPEAMVWRARLVNVLLGVVLAGLFYLACARMFSLGAANLALAPYAFSPALIAHFSLVTTDGAATLMIFATAWQLIRWRKNPNWTNTAFFGCALGLLLLAKFSTVVMFVLALAWMLLLGQDTIVVNVRKWNWGKAAVATAVALIVVWGGYFFHVSHLTIHDGDLVATFPHWSEPFHKAGVSSRNIDLFVPAGEYFEGLREVARHNRAGQPAFFLGTTSQRGGWKSYYPVVILLKCPPILLGLALTALLLLLLRRLPASIDLWVMLSFPAVYFAMALFAHFNQGERHILPLYPFALFLSAALFDRLQQKRWGIVLAIALVCLNAADAFRYAPGYLSYFNPAVKQDEGYRLLSDSNVDWGQGLLALRDYQREHPEEPIRLAYFGSLDPAFYGIKAKPLGEHQNVSGIVVASATGLAGQFLDDPSAYRWLLQYRIVTVLDHSLYVFRVPAP